MQDDFRISEKNKSSARSLGALESERSINVVQRVLEGTAFTTGEDFLRNLVREMASAMKVRYAFVAECIDEDKTKARVLAMWKGSDFGPNVEYAVGNTPCEDVINGEICFYPDSVQSVFPGNAVLKSRNAESYMGIPLKDHVGEIIGHLVIQDDKPMSDRATREVLLKIFAMRAETEIRRKQADKILLESEQKFKNLFQYASIGMGILNSGGRFTQVNPAACQMLGYSEQEFCQKHFLNLTHAKDAARSEKLTDRLVLGEIPFFQIEKRYLHKSGRTVWVLLSASLIRDDKGKAVHIIEQFQDITAHKRAEIELLMKKEVSEKIISAVRSINAALNIEDLLHSVLKETKNIRGVEKATAILFDRRSRTFKLKASTSENIDDELRIELTPEEAEARYYTGSQRVYEDIFVVRPVAGRPAHEKFSRLILPQTMLVMRLRLREQVEGYLIFDNFNDVGAFDRQDVGLLRHVREHIISAVIKMRMLEKLKELNETKNEFLGFAAHDLRNPLHAVLSYSDLMIRDIDQGRITTADMRQGLSSILKATQRMMELVNNLLDVSAIESGRMKLDLEKNCLRSIFEECEARFMKMAQQKSIAFSIHWPETMAPLLFDKLSLSEVVDNLLSNAIKYTRSGGRVNVYFEKTEKEWITHIEDNGVGLDKNDLENIFVNMKKLSARPTAGETSTGFGLVIVKKIIERHQGRIWVDSRKNEGSTFSFSLPLGS